MFVNGLRKEIRYILLDDEIMGLITNHIRVPTHSARTSVCVTANRERRHSPDLSSSMAWACFEIQMYTLVANVQLTWLTILFVVRFSIFWTWQKSLFKMIHFADLGAISLANSNTVIAGCIVFALYYLFQFLNSKKLNFDAPVIGDASDLRSALINGYNQVWTVREN